MRRQLAIVLLAITGLVVGGGAIAYDKLRINDHGPTALYATPSGTVAPVRAFSHAWVIVFENHSFGKVIGSPDAVFFNDLRQRYASLDMYQGVAHPSQPNYFAMVAGSTLDTYTNAPTDVDAPTIFDELESAGRDWRVFAESVPPGCFTGEYATRNLYARKHEPAISFTSIQTSPRRCAKIQDLTSFDPDAADLQFVIPNMCNDSHDCSLRAADDWLEDFLPRITSTPAYLDGGVVFVVFEENSRDEPDNRVPALVISEAVAPGTRSQVPHSHYSLLRTLQDAWALPCLASSCDGNTLGEIFPH